jgi:type I restriction enzyme R subunit
LITDRLTKAKERLDTSLETFFALLEPVPMPRNIEDFYHYFCGRSANATELLDTAPRRQQLYKQTASLVRAYANISKELAAAGYSPTEITKIDDTVREAVELRTNVKLRSGDYIDLKAYEADMRYLIDNYIGAEDSQKISFFDNISIVQLLATNSPADIIQQLPESTRKSQEAVAETIENNVRKLIIDEQATNPKYYEKMSELLDELIQARKDERQNYAEYLASIAQLCQQIHTPNQSQHYPKTLDTNAKRALYDNLEQDEPLSLVLDEAITYARKDDWRNNKFKSKAILEAIKKHLPDEAQAETIFEIIKKHPEY